MRRFMWAFFVLAVWVLVGGVVQAQHRFTSYPVQVTDDFFQTAVSVNHVPSSGSIASIQANTTQLNERQHVCRSGGAHTGSHSVWFKFNFAGGTLVIDTEGSNYNTVMSMYQPAGSFVGLTQVACNDDEVPASEQEARISGAFPAGTYFVQISRYETSPGAGPYTLQLAISAALTGVAPANDNFANAQPIRFNESLTTQNVQYSTEEAAEPNRTCAASRPSHSIWYSITRPAGSPTILFNATTEGSHLDFGDVIGLDTVIEVFYGASVGALTPVACNDDFVATFAALTSLSFPMGVDTMYIRLTVFGSENLIEPSSYKLKITIVQYSMLNSEYSFETVPLTNWTLSNAFNGDGQICNVPNTFFDGVCSVRFIGGPNEATTLKQSFVLPPQLLFRKGHSIYFVYALKPTVTTFNFKGVLTITYSDGTPPSKIVLKLKEQTSANFIVTGRDLVLPTKHVSGMKATFKNKSASGTFYLDPVLVHIIGSLGREAAAPLPPPPAK